MRERDSSFAWGVVFFVGTIIILIGLAVLLFVKSGKQTVNNDTNAPAASQAASDNLAAYQQCIETAKVQYDLDAAAAAAKENADVSACKAEYGM